MKYMRINLRIGTEVISALNLTSYPMMRSYRIGLNTRNDYKIKGYVLHKQWQY